MAEHELFGPEITKNLPHKDALPPELKYFAYGHLSQSLRLTAQACADVACHIAAYLQADHGRESAFFHLRVARNAFMEVDQARSRLDMSAFAAAMNDRCTAVVEDLKQRLRGRFVNVSGALLALLRRLTAHTAPRVGDAETQMYYGLLALQSVLHELTYVRAVPKFDTAPAVWINCMLSALDVGSKPATDEHAKPYPATGTGACVGYTGADESEIKNTEYGDVKVSAQDAQPSLHVDTDGTVRYANPAAPPAPNLATQLNEIDRLIQMSVDSLAGYPLRNGTLKPLLGSTPEIRHRFMQHLPRTTSAFNRQCVVRKILSAVAAHVSFLIPGGREREQFLTKLEEAMFVAEAGIVRNQPNG